MIQEAFVNIECTLKGTQDLSGAGITSMIIGQVQHISVEEEYAHGYEKRYRKVTDTRQTGSYGSTACLLFSKDLSISL